MIVLTVSNMDETTAPTKPTTEDASRMERTLRDHYQRQLDERVKPEIQALAQRGNVTLTEVRGLRCNSWEWEHLYPAMTDEALMDSVEHALKNCARSPSPCQTYDEAVVSLFAPELLQRFAAMVKVFGSVPRTER